MLAAVPANLDRTLATARSSACDERGNNVPWLVLDRQAVHIRRIATIMIRAAFALLTLAVFAAIDSHPAAAEVYRPWCVVYSGRDGAYTCIFTSFEQCMMTATPGTGGSCVQNPWYARYGEHGRGQDGGDRRRSERQ